jgi:hypothetical protein
VTVALVICFGNLNGIISSNVYSSNQAPYFTLGHSIVLTYTAVFLVGGHILNYTLLRMANKKRDLGGEAKKAEILNGLTPEEEASLADFHPDFRYTL